MRDMYRLTTAARLTRSFYLTLPALTRAVVVGASTVLLAALASTAAAQSTEPYPSRPLRLIVGFPAGGPTDVPARVLAERLRVALGQPVIVENKPGASGMVGLQEMLSRPRDGYELLMCTYIDPINPVLYRSARYAITDIAPISQVTRAHYALAVRKNFPGNTFAEFIAYAKTQPEKVTYGHVGPGSILFIGAKQIERLTGAKMLGISYKGTPPLIQDLVGERIDLVVGPLVSTMPLVKSGALKAIGVTSPQRLEVAPDIPTLTEQGTPLVLDAWLGVCAGQGVAPERIQLLNRHVVDAVASDGFRNIVESSGSMPTSSTPQAFQRLFNETARETGELIKSLGISMD